MLLYYLNLIRRDDGSLKVQQQLHLTVEAGHAALYEFMFVHI